MLLLRYSGGSTVSSTMPRQLCLLLLSYFLPVLHCDGIRSVYTGGVRGDLHIHHIYTLYTLYTLHSLYTLHTLYTLYHTIYNILTIHYTSNATTCHPIGTPTAANALFLSLHVRNITNLRATDEANVGGIIFSIEPDYAFVGGCKQVNITGWALSMPDDPIVSVTVARGFAYIDSQTDREVIITVGQTYGVYGTGDVVISQLSGRQSILRSSFTYRQPAEIAENNFEKGALVDWSMEGLEWEVRSYCSDMGCSNPNEFPPDDGGPAAGQVV